MIAYRSIATLALILTARFAAAEEEEAVKVFNQVKGCVVGIESVANSGSGILIDDKGLVLTNAHVVAVPLRYRCTVEVIADGKEETKVFNKVKIVSAHPTADLALIQFDPAEHDGQLSPAALAKKKAQTGQRVYAIGNPGMGKDVKLTRTITAGLLSGVDRQIEGVAYYQFDAATSNTAPGAPPWFCGSIIRPRACRSPIRSSSSAAAR
jgi:S1-C subfamily serine protease